MRPMIFHYYCMLEMGLYRIRFTFLNDVVTYLSYASIYSIRFVKFNLDYEIDPLYFIKDSNVL
jgi:hypothetical protein